MEIKYTGTNAKQLNELLAPYRAHLTQYTEPITDELITTVFRSKPTYEMEFIKPGDYVGVKNGKVVIFEKK